MISSGVGSMPGEDFPETLRLVLDQCPDLPFVPELPARGVAASMIGRSLAMVTELGFDLQPAGWRLGSPGVDHRRAQSQLGQDLDTLEELTQGYVGQLKLQVAGPWTLASAVEKPRGDKVLSDIGARRELGQALAVGIASHVADVQRRVRGATLVVQIDEPALPFVLSGSVPTASGFHRHRSVDPARASALLEEITAVAPTAIVHCCSADVPFGLLRGAGFAGLSLDADLLSASSYDELGVSLDAGQRLFLGVIPTDAVAPDPKAVTERVLRLLDMLGFDPDEVGDQVVLTPACGLAGTDATAARRTLEVLRAAARDL